MKTELPPGVTKVIDRHGKCRWRFRMAGRWPCYISGQPGDDDFASDYAAACQDMMPDDISAARQARAHGLMIKANQRRMNQLVNAATDGSWIYIVGPSRGPVKIGWTSNLKSRLIRLQTASPVKLKLLAVMVGTRAEESALHRQFADARLSGEWFTRTREITDMIRKHRPRLSNLNLSNHDAGNVIG